MAHQTLEQQAMESLLGQLAVLMRQLGDEEPEIYFSSTVRSNWSWLPEVDIDGSEVEIEGGFGFDLQMRGDTVEQLHLESFESAGVTVYNDVESVFGRGLDFTGLRFYGQVNFAELQGDYLFAAFDEQVTVEFDGDNGVFELSGDDDEFIASYESGDVTVNSHSGNDEIITGSGDDDVRSSDGNDYVFTGDGDDIIRGAGGEDYLHAAGGDDTVLGGDGDDVIVGGEGNDALNGQAGNDRVFAGSGNDALIGEGNDTLDGGAGEDQFLFTLTEGGNGAVHTGWDVDPDLVLINNVGIEGNIAIHLGVDDQAIAYTKGGTEIDLSALYEAAGGEDFTIGATTFSDDLFLKG